MNFRKNKSGDVKRASYYVWFLGAKESKGLRGDQFVRPALNFMLDKQDSAVEPSKVTLQVSNKGLKIIQILSVPRKSAKLNADQQMLLFAANQRLRKDLGPSASSLLKTEQVKHHIPHNAITWVFQDQDIICTILLLYNPLTRCPVHVHAYRCDSIETANSLRAQLQTLVDRPENQKKFREIETRLAAKGLLLGSGSGNGFGFGSLEHSPKELHLDGFEDEPTSMIGGGVVNSVVGSNGTGSTGGIVNGSVSHVGRHSPESPELLRYGSATTKTLNSDGRSTRTDGSDEVSEESNSSDLGYAVRSSKHQTSNSTRMMYNNSQHLKSDMRLSKTSSNSRETSKAQPYRMPTIGKNYQEEMPTQEVQPASLTAALYDSLAAELRAKIGNPKAGPILLPPKDYEAESKTNLVRSESSGKSSSGRGSEEAIETSNDTRRTKVPIVYRHFGDSPEPKSFIDSYRIEKFNESDSDSDSFDGNLVDDDIGEDFEEEVLYTDNRMSKSFFDIPKTTNTPIRPYHVPEPDYTMKRPTGGVMQKVQQQQQRNRSQTKMFASNPNLARLSSSSNHLNSTPSPTSHQQSPSQAQQQSQQPQQQQQSQQYLQANEYSNRQIGRREQRTLGGGANAPQRQIHSSKNVQKFYFADAEFGQELSNSTHFDDFEVSKQRRRQLGRSSGNLVIADNYGPTSLGYFYQSQAATDRSLSPQTFYHHYPPQKPARKSTTTNATNESAIHHSQSATHSNSPSQLQQQIHSQNVTSRRSYESQPSSLINQIPPRHTRDDAYSHHQQQQSQQYRRKLEQPFSRYSYAPDRYESSRFANFLPPLRR